MLDRSNRCVAHLRSGHIPVTTETTFAASVPDASPRVDPAAGLIQPAANSHRTGRPRKLTFSEESEVLAEIARADAIRRELSLYSYRAIAQRFGISHTTVRNIGDQRRSQTLRRQTMREEFSE